VSDYDPYDHPVEGYCPACGASSLYLSFSIPTCMQKGCPNPTIIGDILDDGEIHHIVRFSDADFNVKHPLRERADSELLDCKIHGVIVAWSSSGTSPFDGQPLTGTSWRVKYKPELMDDPEFGGDPFSWERT